MGKVLRSVKDSQLHLNIKIKSEVSPKLSAPSSEVVTMKEGGSTAL